MNRFISMMLVVVFAMLAISWGVSGHKTLAQIAENHLTEHSKNAIRSLLGNQSLADVATWADDARRQPAYRNTSPWHFLNVPDGLTFPQFINEVKNQGNNNVYTALLKCERDLSDINTSAAQKAIALKFIVHFAGDLHQPMHISRAEDKGGNTIQVRYEMKGTNLHSLWDSKLLDHQGLSYNQIARACDVATPAQIKQWQSDDVLLWIFESYQISSQLYAEISKSKNIDEQYYSLHLPIIQQRLAKGGVRLAGILNNTLKSFHTGDISILPSPIPAQKNSIISINEINNHIGEQVTVCTKMFGFKCFGSMTLVNMGANYPDQLLTIVLKGDLKEEYKEFGTNQLCISGKLLTYRGKPQIIVTDYNQVKIN